MQFLIMESQVLSQVLDSLYLNQLTLSFEFRGKFVVELLVDMIWIHLNKLVIRPDNKRGVSLPCDLLFSQTIEFEELV